MRQSLVPVLLLAIVALSTSNVLTMLSPDFDGEVIPSDRANNDNTYKNRFQSRHFLNNLIFKSTVYNKFPNLRKATQLENFDADNNGEDNCNVFNKIDQFNGEGFRKEQWHNYPRQLDRLHNDLNEYRDAAETNLVPDDPGNENYNDKKSNIRNNHFNYITNTYEFLKDVDKKDTYDSNIVKPNPIFILKIRLACLGNDKDNNLIASELESNNEERNGNSERLTNEIIPANSMMKVKREDESARFENSAENNTFENKSVRKRIFSLWSRLQSLNHKGHQLHHRRHLHAFYGMPDSDGGGVLTAETRAIFMRPPGSPLRWG